MEDILKLGTVVKLIDTDGELMVAGYYPEEQETGSVYTYLGISPVYGISFSNDVIFFNQDKVSEIVFDGYSDEASDKFREKVKEFMRTPYV